LQKIHSTAPMAPVATVDRNSIDFGYGRSREVGEKKEEREGIRLHALPAAEEHRGDRNLAGKRQRRFCSGGGALLLVVACGGSGQG
jgi:hypothetical protein